MSNKVYSGQVAWYNGELEFGCIKGADGEIYFFDSDSILPGDSFPEYPKTQVDFIVFRKGYAAEVGFHG